MRSEAEISPLVGCNGARVRQSCSSVVCAVDSSPIERVLAGPHRGGDGEGSCGGGTYLKAESSDKYAIKQPTITKEMCYMYDRIQRQ